MAKSELSALVIVSGLLLPACQRPTPEMQLVHDTAEAMGGLNDVTEVENLVLTGQGRQYRLGQNQYPMADLPYWEINEFTRVIDFGNQRWKLTQVRSSAFLTGNPSFNQEQVLGLDGDVAYDVGTDSTARRVAAQVAAERKAEFYHHPVALTQLAMLDGSMVTNLRHEDGQNVVDITSADGDTYTLYVDSETNWPSQIVSDGYNPNLGDVAITTEFDDYQETGGLGGFSTRMVLPRAVSVRIDDWPMWDLRVTTTTNQPIEDISAPEEVRSAEPATFQADVQVEEVTDGVWLLAGQSHHSVLIEFDEFLALVEAPQNDARTLAVITQARDLRPAKPLRYLINSHHHFDHSGGVRAAVSEGLTIITHEFNRVFFENLVSRPHTRIQDALARRPQPLILETVSGDEVFELRSGRTLQVMRIVADEHSDSILMGYLPGERILIEADAFSVALRAAPFAANLLTNIRDRELRVDRIVPIHGEVIELAVLEEAVAAASRPSG